jgi:hypothetical protein
MTLAIEEDMLPRRVCGNCLGNRGVSWDASSGRRLCVECEPHPMSEATGKRAKCGPKCDHLVRGKMANGWDR